MPKIRAREATAARREGEIANRMKDEFLATISHELRTPLNAVLGWVHLLRTGRLDAPTSTRGLESIDRNVRLQAQLTADLLDVSKALTGKLRLDSHPAALDDAVRQAVSAAMPAAKAKGVQLLARAGRARRRPWRPDAPATDRVAIDRQRDQVHASRRHYRNRHACGEQRGAAERCRTVDTASTPRFCPRYSTGLRRPILPRPARQVGLASAWRSCGSSSNCTAVRSTRGTAPTGTGPSSR